MLLILLKSAACLAIFMAFYKLFLERENMHHFKRFYLLAALVVSFAIPFITFIKYIEPAFEVPNFNADHSVPLILLPVDDAIVKTQINYLPIILWSLYGLGVLLFGIKFGLNLFRIISRINKNEKQKQGHFITVLLKDLVAPHTFFSYIFLNKIKFETKAIPQEVLLHEATHAKQKHSIDILFIELLQVVFWFNPLLYFIKKDIKLNHEFLADEAVLKYGIDSSTYQNTLLAFSSHATEPELANAINYSLIKKRFTIMKTKTSKRAVWLRSLLLLPLLGGLLFSFSSTKEVEKEITPIMEISETPNELLELEKVNALKINFSNPILELKQNPLELKLNGKTTTIATIKKDFISATKGEKSDLRIEATGAVDFEIIKKLMSVISKDYLLKIKLSEQAYIEDKTEYSNKNETTARSIDIKVFKNGTYKVDGIKANKNTFKDVINQLHQDISPEVRNNIMNIHVNSPKNISDQEVWFIYNSVLDYGFYRIVAYNQEVIRAKGNKPFAIESNNTQETLLIINGIVCDKCELFLSKKGVENMILSTTTGDNILSYKIKIPGNSTVLLKGDKLNKEAIKYLNTASIGTVIQLFDIKLSNKQKLPPVKIKLVDKNAKKYSHSPMVKKGETSNLPPPPPPPAPIKEYNRMKANAKVNLPPPPPPAPPKTPVKHAKEMASKGAAFFYNGNSISSTKAIELIENNEKVNISTHTNNGKSTVHLSTKPIRVVNGKAVMDEQSTQVIEDRKETIIERSKALLEERENAMEDRKRAMEERESIIEEREHKMHDLYKDRKPLAEQFKGMEENGGAFFYEGDKIAEAKAIALIKENPKLNVSMQNLNGKSTVHLSTKGINVVNGKLVKSEN